MQVVFCGVFWSVFLWILYRIENEADVSTDVTGGLWREWMLRAPEERKLLKGGNLELCGLRSTELSHSQIFEVAAVKSGKFLFIILVSGHRFRNLHHKQNFFPFSSYERICKDFRGPLQAPVQSAPSSRGVSEGDSSALGRKTLLGPLQGCASWRSCQEEMRQTNVEMCSGLEKTAEVEEG